MRWHIPFWTSYSAWHPVARLVARASLVVLVAEYLVWKEHVVSNAETTNAVPATEVVTGLIVEKRSGSVVLVVDCVGVAFV